MEFDPEAVHHTLCDCPEFLLQLEEYKRGDDQFLLAHVRVKSWSPSTLKKIKAVWFNFREFVSAPIYAYSEHDDEKWQRFVAHFGFRPLGINITCNNGAQRPLFIHLV